MAAWIPATVSLVCAAESDFSPAALQLSSRGDFSGAVVQWRKAIDEAHRQGRVREQITSSIQLAAALQALGQQAEAVRLLEEAEELAQKLGDRELSARSKGQLGAGLALLRQSERAEELLRESLEIARAEKWDQLAAAAWNDLGNLLAAQRKSEAAAEAYGQSVGLARQAGDSALVSRALVNQAALSARAGWHDQAEQQNGQALAEIARLDPSHEQAFLLLTAAQTDSQIQPADGDSGKKRLLLRSHQSAERARAVAESLGDRVVLSYVLGHLGHLYERDGQLGHALALTRQAARQAQQAQWPDASYRWEWQAGRLLKAQGNADQAIAAYRRAVQSLQPIRHDVALGYGNAAVPASFRETLGPLFFELADLLLTRVDGAGDDREKQQWLREARETVEQLKAVELEDYFQDDCVNVMRAKTASVEQVDPRSAVLYLIPLPARTEILVSLTSGMHRFTAPVGAEELVALVRQFRRNLETRTSNAYREQAKQLYDLLIRPIRERLLENDIKTLVFVPDGALQTIPLVSLYDGKRFLIEEFAVATTPGLSLVEPRPIERQNPQVLLSGLSDAVQGFPSLEFVPDELKEIETAYQSQTLLNNTFVTASLEQKLSEEQFPIVHIASHGQFDRDARKTFVLTYDGKLTLNQLEALIRPSQYRGRPVELLVLSACQTAAGDDRAALGLAGVAVKAGARSVVASLWFVNDQSTAAFVSELYRQLRQTPALSRAQAVQAAQRKMLADRRFRHPCYWAPYLLIGNWL